MFSIIPFRMWEGLRPPVRLPLLPVTAQTITQVYQTQGSSTQRDSNPRFSSTGSRGHVPLPAFPNCPRPLDDAAHIQRASERACNSPLQTKENYMKEVARSPAQPNRARLWDRTTGILAALPLI